MTGYAIAAGSDGRAVFVTGWGGVGLQLDFITLAYAQADGRLLWSSRYSGPGTEADAAIGVVTDPTGSMVYVSGVSRGDGTGDDYATVAYDAATGDQLWSARFNDPIDDYDQPTALGVNPDGSQVFVTGQTWFDDRTAFDFGTVAYDAQTGTQQWFARFRRQGSSNDSALALAVDPGGTTVYVTGCAALYTCSYSDWATVSYLAADGSERWSQKYDGSSHEDDIPNDIGVSPDGHLVFVTGTSEVMEGEGQATIAYRA